MVFLLRAAGRYAFLLIFASTIHCLSRKTRDRRAASASRVGHREFYLHCGPLLT